MKDKSVYTLSADQVLLKGSILRNTGTVHGVACYTGHQTKVMKNSLKARVKKSKVELQTNYYIIIIVMIQLLVCISSALFNAMFSSRDKETKTYLYYDYMLSFWATLGLSFF